MSVLQRPKDFFDDDEIEYLRSVSDWRSLWSLVHCWGVILLTWIVVAIGVVVAWWGLKGGPPRDFEDEAA